VSAAPRFAPYRESAANDLYHLLFCDDPQAFASMSAGSARAIAGNATHDARMRMLACNWLAAHGEVLPAKELLGVIVEVPLDAGLDTLAAFADGGVRYINHTGKMSIFEGRNTAIGPSIDKLFAASRDVIARIGPWDKPRLAPPSRGRVRLTFLVTDGLYFGEGPMEMFQRDAMAGPVVAAASELLVKVVDLSTEK
jgi:hypothetical protein